jgi:Tol biopolymer transport system component
MGKRGVIMRRLIQVLSGIWFLITILLTVVLVAGQVLSGSAEMIVFQSQRESHADIYLLDVPTGITRNLTRQPGRMQPLRPGSDDDTAEYPAQPQRFIGQWSDVSPALSPDGRQLAFVSYRDGNSEIYLLDLHTGSLRNLMNHPGADSSPVWSPPPVWSPDGTHLAFESTRNGNRGISVIDVETGIIRDLTGHSYASQSPTWSPDSQRIVFQARRGRYWNLYMIDLETGETRTLTNSASDDHNPAWTTAWP